MSWQTKNTKKIFMVSVSLILGGTIIVGALMMSGLIGVKKTEGPSDEWKDGLSVVPGADILARIKKSSVNVDDASSQATTTTDIISRRLLVEYALSQKNTSTSTMSDVDVQKIASVLAQEVKISPQKEYALTDLNISKDNTYDANLLYVRSISNLLKNFVATGQKETELTLLVKVVDSNDTNALGKLDEKIIIYQKLIENLLTLKTPSNVAPVHLRLIQAYETLRSSTGGFKKMLSDPVVAIASLGEYGKGIDALSLVEKDLREFKF